MSNTANPLYDPAGARRGPHMELGPDYEECPRCHREIDEDNARRGVVCKACEGDPDADDLRVKQVCSECAGGGQICRACGKDSRCCQCGAIERTLTYCRKCGGNGKRQASRRMENKQSHG